MKKVLILLGPTCVGKTGVAILLARALHTEIISADSMQIFRHMDIGTAKPSQEERAIVTHHMIDIVDPWESYSTGKYIRAVMPVIERLHQNGKIPIVTGGTGLYIKAMTRGIFHGPSADWDLRERLLSIEHGGKGSLYAALKEVDPEAAEKITPNDTRRLIRALEVILKSNATMSGMQKHSTLPLAYDFVKIGLTRERKELYRMIEKRVDAMLENGLVHEVKKVMEMVNRQHEQLPSPPVPYPSMQAIGYKETAQYLRGEIPLAEAVRLIKQATKRFAKRQFTWFRKEEGIQWVEVTGIHDCKEAFVRVYGVVKTLLD
ncbi:MAG: tRNA (adenosine(37)-N6)-dimethylallyltransferase MiaA [Nitrospirota bacterium]